MSIVLGPKLLAYHCCHGGTASREVLLLHTSPLYSPLPARIDGSDHCADLEKASFYCSLQEAVHDLMSIVVSCNLQTVSYPAPYWAGYTSTPACLLLCCIWSFGMKRGGGAKGLFDLISGKLENGNNGFSILLAIYMRVNNSDS
jgi:hypothetical protein